MVSADDAVARASVSLAARDARSVRIISDGSLYGDLMAAEMTREAEASGLGVRSGGKMDAVLYAGGPEGAAEAVRAGTQGGAGRVVVTDAAGEGVAGLDVGTAELFVVAGVLSQQQLPATTDLSPGPYGAFGYEAMRLALHGIAEAEGQGEFRPAVRDAIIGATRDSLLGPFTIDEEGDTSLCTVQPYLVEEAAFETLPLICES
jgi:hypothetical protein